MKRFFSVLFLISFLSTIFFSISSAEESNGEEADIAIVFTHDLHSHLEPFVLNGNSVGGFSRIQTVINETRSSFYNTLVLDAGDFSMGTLYQSAFETAAPEYSMLAELGFDATIFGNHEFDYGFDAVRKMISSAQSNTPSLPPILCSNIDSEASGLSESELNSLNIKEYTIIKKGDYNIAVFGLIGRDAVQLSSSSKLVFTDFIESAKNTVAEIENLYSPDLIICLSHSGTGPDVDDEDIALAKAVPAIDFIVSGHTHTALSAPVIVGETVIGSCGEYGENVGRVLFDIENGKPELVSYKLVRIDNSISSDESIELKINDYKKYVSEYLQRFGYCAPDDILAYSPFEFPEQSSMGEALAEQQLGNLISDSYVYALKNAEGDEYIPVDVAVAPLGVIRASIDQGNITVSQVFEISSVGIGNDGVAGYPLCSVYLYGRELWDLAEVDASVSAIVPYAQLYSSGLNYSVNKNRMFLNKVYDCWLTDQNGNRIEIEDDKLYRVVSGMSSVLLLGTVKEKSFGLLEITPKDSNGSPITEFDEFIAFDRVGAEVKEWKALADYLSSFPENDKGIPQIPYDYFNTQGRKNVNDSFAFSQIFTHWTLISWIVLIILLLLVFVIVVSVTSIVKKKRRSKRSLIVDSEISD